MAAGGTPSNVTLGPGRLRVAPLGTAEPTTATATPDAAFRDVGYTEDGSAFSTALTNEAVNVAEEVDPIRYVLSTRANTLVVTMAETTRENLALALGAGAAAAASGGFEPPDPGEEVAVMVLWDSHDDPTDPANRRWLYRQAKPGGTIEIPRRKAPAKSVIGVTFNLEKPDGAAPWKAFPNAAGLI